MASKSVVSSIFDDGDMFSAPAPKPTTKQPGDPSRTAGASFTPFEAPDDAKPTLGTDSLLFSGHPQQKPLPVVVKKPVFTPSAPYSPSEFDLPDPEPLPDVIFKAAEPLAVQAPRPEPIVEPPKPQPAPVAKPVAPTPVPSTPITQTPTRSTSRVSQLPSPFAGDLFIPPRDGGAGETPKARLMQEKLFYRYVNAYLGQRGLAISSLQDLVPGVFFIMLVETVSHSPMPDALASHCSPNPSTPEEFHSNFHYACQHLFDLGKPLPQLPLSGQSYQA